ncbi:MAG TPA: hemerythrin domain-containing protein [Terriglobales bacterium]|nr:hemerythrin domain-containing protein [Terriglobales bacterium]
MASSGFHAGFGGQEFDSPTQLLSAEHRVIERVLSVVDKLTGAPIEESLDSWKKALDFIRGFADQCHHLKEEKVLFPALEEHGIPSEGGPVGMMLLEHEEARGHVKEMMAAIKRLEANESDARENLVTHAKAYRRLLQEHIQKEDDILFRMADDVIPSPAQSQLLKAFEQHEIEEMGSNVHEKYLSLAAELEAKVK